VAREARRGYGAACRAALRAMAASDPVPPLSPLPDIVVFMDADGSHPVDELPRLLEPIIAGAADLVIGVRSPGDLPAHVALGNRLACLILRGLTGHAFRDLGPFRAIRYESLRRLELRDPDYGWNVEMQARAVAARLRILEVPVPHRPRRAGRSKISGSVMGTIRAGGKILGTALREGLRARRR
jgi:glycosyltransferase involved in cell wall biosynthesis